MRILLLLSIFLSSISYANKCQTPKYLNKPTDLRSKFGPIREQGDMGWCYAYSGADLLGFYAKEHNKLINPTKRETQISAVHMANTNNTNNERKIREKNDMNFQYKFTEPEGGHTDDAINSLLDNGYCLEKDALSEKFNFKSGNCFGFKARCSLKSIIKTINQYKIFKTNKCEAINAARALSVNVPMKQIISALKNATDVNAFNDVVAGICTPKKLSLPNKKAYAHHLNPFNSHVFLQIIDDKLAKGEPTEVGFEVGELLNNKAKYNHTSVVVGKKYNCKTHKFDYILRNSWGSSCAPYYKSNSNNYKKVNRCRSKLSQKYTSVFQINNLEKRLAKAINEGKKRSIKVRTKLLKQSKRKAKLSDIQFNLQYKKCLDDNRTAKLLNPKLRCEGGHIIVPPEELKRTIKSITYISDKKYHQKQNTRFNKALDFGEKNPGYYYDEEGEEDYDEEDIDYGL
ncbi:MAG: hypothetical protein HON90_09285 [Halobacteriovoraceae bacterium]|jgi:hypothetical protein|nr:hypothetical protein [Halobacteriovoraceae bacterium]